MKKIINLLLFACLSLTAHAVTEVRYFAVAAASGTTGTETAITLTSSRENLATTTGVSFLVPTGKKFHITSIILTAVGNATGTTQTTTFSVRVNAAGAVTTSSTPILLKQRIVTQANANQTGSVTLWCGDYDFDIFGDGTTQFGITANAVYTTNAPTWDVTITGYEI